MKSIKLSTLLWLVMGISLTSVGVLTYYFTAKIPPSLLQNIVVAVSANVTPNAPPGFIASIGGTTPETAMNGPLSVTVSDIGRIYVADTGNSRIQVYDPNGQFLFQFGKEAPEESRLEMPVTVGWNRGNLYVGDIRRNTIFIFDGTGNLIRSVTEADLGRNLTPLAFAFEGDTLYVASAPGYIYVIDSAGTLVRTIGKPGGPEGYLGYPNGLVIMDGKVVVADSNNQRIQVYDKEGTLLSVSTDLQLSLPRGMALDRFGRLFVVDTFGHSVVAADQELRPLFRFGERGLDEGQLNFPNQIAADRGGKLYVADRENNRVMVFGY